MSDTWKSIFVVSAVFAYFALPFDLIPDLLPPITYIDDAAVVGWAIKYFSDRKKRQGAPQGARQADPNVIDAEFTVNG